MVTIAIATTILFWTRYYGRRDRKSMRILQVAEQPGNLDVEGKS